MGWRQSAGCSEVAVAGPCKRLSTERCGEPRVRQCSPVEAASPLARRPYDLRHACTSLMLNAGVPATEAARRLGHSVAMLLKRYANCIDGQELDANARIARALEDGGV